MAKTLQSGNATAIADVSATALRDFLWIVARETSDNSDDDHFLTNYGYNITANAINARTGDEESHNYIGDGGPIIYIPPIPETLGWEIRNIQIRLNILHATVADMARGHNLRSAKVQIHRGYLGRTDRKLTDAMEPRWYGYVERSKIITGALGQESELQLECVSHSREFTRTSHAMWSEEYINERATALGITDTFGEWLGNTKDTPVWWGEESRSGDE